MKLIAGASAGGHANELKILIEAARGVWPYEPAAYVTTMEITAKSFAKYGRPVYVVGEADRRKPFRAIAVLIRTFRLVRRERPDVVITTGSMPLAMLCMWAKLFGSRIVWIDCSSHVERMTLSGRLIRPVADLCLAQWADVAALYPNVEYAGELI